MLHSEYLPPQISADQRQAGAMVGARGGTVSILAMGSNQLVLDETERSLHDALCVVRCLVKKRYVCLSTQ